MKNAYLEINLECNLRCKFCSVGTREPRTESMEDIKAFLEKAQKTGHGKVVITGGEPLGDERLEQIVACADDVGIGEVCIQTNGTLMTPEKAEGLREAGLKQAVFSIHSHLPEVEDELMGGEGVLERQLEGLQNAHDAGMFCFVTLVITEDNYRQMRDFFKFMVEEYPFVEHFTLNFVDPVGRADANEDVVPRVSEVEPFLASALMLLERSGKTFRVERVPLCYLLEFAEFNTELRRIVTPEINRVRRDREVDAFTKEYFEDGYEYGEACDHCWIKPVCPGFNRDYTEIYGTSEAYPIFIDPERIVERTGAD